MTRSQVLEVLQADYIRTAHAKGLHSLTIVRRHALRNALIPVVTIWGGQAAGLLGGSVLMESMFGIPGLGQWTAESIRLRDYPVTQALVLFFALTTLTINLVVDVSYTWLDPRVRIG
jgi:peptide/nickel transport system permease protein